MPRRRRLDLPDIPQHIVHRGNNRGVTFFADEDRADYLALVEEHAAWQRVRIHAYVLMTNHVHLLATPERWGAMSAMMQDIGREYVTRINRRYRRTGTLWEGRFHSCPVQSGSYLLTCMRYIELNPVRAGMVGAPSDYAWSSYRRNAEGVANPWLSPHPVYASLGADRQSRCAAYRALFAGHWDEDTLTSLRRHTRQGAAWGGERFQREIESALGRRVAYRARGRPRKLQAERESVEKGM